MTYLIRKLVITLFFLILLLPRTAIAIKVYLPHITGGTHDWQDYLQSDNITSESLTFQLTLYASGSPVYHGTFTVNAFSERVIKLKDLAATAETGVITYADDRLTFRLSYKNLVGGGGAEFHMTGDQSQLLAFYFSDILSTISWKGIALANMNYTTATTTLYAVGDGRILGKKTINILPYQRVVGIHTKWFPSVKLNEIKKIIVVSNSNLLGITISGNQGSSIMLFTAAAPITDFNSKGQGEVTITSPTTDSTYTTSQSQIIISGSASSDSGIDSITWSNSLGGSGVCTGTTSWSATIPLYVGQNVITISTTDFFGNTVQTTLSVSRGSGLYTLSGTISASKSAILDGDVNDPNETYLPNDTPDTSQSITNPTTLGGYVNKPFTGENGRSYAIGDEDDFFSVNLDTGDKILLFIAEYENADLDLYLYDLASGEYVDRSIGTQNFEMLTIQKKGIYAVNVYADSGASNYVLAIGARDTYVTGSPLSLSSDFVPGEAIVKFKDHTISSGAGILSKEILSEKVSTLGMRLASGDAGRMVLLSFDQEDELANALQALSINDNDRINKPVSKENQKKMDTLRVIKALQKRSDVVYAEPNYICQKFAMPNDPSYDMQWHYPLINLSKAWDITTGSSDVVVAVLDSGILMNHPDLKSNLANDGYDFVRSPSISLDGDGIDNDPNDPGGRDYLNGDSSFHGTHCAGIIAASSNNSLGVSGVGWSTQIMPVRVMGLGGEGYSYDILQGMLYAAGLPNDSGKGPEKAADIINLSLGGDRYSQAEQEVYTQVRNAGTIIIAAAGNKSVSRPFYPASYDGVMSVSAVERNAKLSTYSNFGDRIDVAAPGGEYRGINDEADQDGDGTPDMVFSTLGDDSSGRIQYNYGWLAGTSMAAPHVAGVVALMKAVRPELTPDELDYFLQQFNITDDIGTSGRDDRYGYGLINAYKAVQTARSETSPNILSVTPTVLYFGYFSSIGTLVVSNSGFGVTRVTDYRDNVSWLTVTATDIDTNGLGSYTVQINRNGLPAGNHDANITFLSTENSVTVPVRISVHTWGFESNTGFHYVLLVKPDTLEAVQQQDVKAVNGYYSFTFTKVEHGEYKIYGGSDRDNDGVIGDEGEAIGAYISRFDPEIITVTGHRSNLDFGTDFNFSIPAISGAGSSVFVPQMRRIQKMKSLR